jgi:hypothetical protein
MAISKLTSGTAKVITKHTMAIAQENGPAPALIVLISL